MFIIMLGDKEWEKNSIESPPNALADEWDQYDGC